MIEILEWDSNFFEKKVCSVVGTVNNEEEAQTLFTHLAQNDIEHLIRLKLMYSKLNYAI